MLLQFSCVPRRVTTSLPPSPVLVSRCAHVTVSTDSPTCPLFTSGANQSLPSHSDPWSKFYYPACCFQCSVYPPTLLRQLFQLTVIKKPSQPADTGVGWGRWGRSGWMWWYGHRGHAHLTSGLLLQSGRFITCLVSAIIKWFWIFFSHPLIFFPRLQMIIESETSSWSPSKISKQLYLGLKEHFETNCEVCIYFIKKFFLTSLWIKKFLNQTFSALQ